MPHGDTYTPKFNEMFEIAKGYAARHPNGQLDVLTFIGEYASSHRWVHGEYQGSDGSAAWENFLLFKGDEQHWHYSVKPYILSDKADRFPWRPPPDPRPVPYILHSQSPIIVLETPEAVALEPNQAAKPVEIEARDIRTPTSFPPTAAATIRVLLEALETEIPELITDTSVMKIGVKDDKAILPDWNLVNSQSGVRENHRMAILGVTDLRIGDKV